MSLNTRKLGRNSFWRSSRHFPDSFSIRKGRGRVRTLIGPLLDFQKKAYPQMQNLTANLLVINSTHFENNFMISRTDYSAIFVYYFLHNILKIAYSKYRNHEYQRVSFDRARRALQAGILFPIFDTGQKNFLYEHTL